MFSSSVLDYYNREVDNFREVQELTCSFMLKWLNYYEIVYHLNNLQKQSMDCDTLKKIIWEVTSAEFDSNFIHILNKYINYRQIPCPIKKQDKFKAFITKHLGQLALKKEGEIQNIKEELENTISNTPLLERPIINVCPVINTYNDFRRMSIENITIPEFLNGYEMKCLSNYTGVNQSIWLPMTERWQIENGKPNFLTHGDYEMLELLIITLLLSFPIGKMKITFVDLEFNRELSAIKNRLHETFVDRYILDESEFADWIRQKNLQLQKTFAEMGDIVEYNLKTGKINGVYELCILNGIPSSLRHDAESGLKQLLKQGHHAGIYFAVVKTSSTQGLISDENFISLKYGNYPSNLYQQKERHELLAMLNDEVEKEATRKIQEKEVHKQENKFTLLTQDFDDATKNISVEMGISKNGQPTSFTLDSPHALVLGKTGSGKSNFLHLLLTGSMLKYSPETLHFYLMDMKPGGVELADYRDMPHVSVLVADPGDAPINVEFLMNIKEQIEIRARRMQKEGVRDLQGYNIRNPDKKLPRIVMLIDEFQSLFDRKKYTDLSMMLEVESLLSEILAKGRSYGIHAILSTQTLMGTQIPESVAKVEKQYFLKADTFDMTDIRMFVRDVPEKELEEMRSHEAFSVDNANHSFQHFMPELLLDEESRSLQDRLHAVIEKCKKYQTKNVKSVYYSVTQLECPDLAGGLGEMYYSDYPEVSIGRSIEINSMNVSVRFENAKGQNLLITGVNERGRFCTEEGGKWQGLRILLISLISLLHYSNSQQANSRFIFLLNSPDLKAGNKGNNYIQELKKSGNVEIYRGAEEQLGIVESLLEQVKVEQEDRMTFVFVEGQDYYRLDKELRNASDSNKDEESRLFSFGNKPFGGSGGQKQTVRDAWLKILEDGPLYGIHTIWQVQNFERALTDAPSSRHYFQNMAFLYNNTLRPVSFKMTEDIDFKRLDASNERLRMCLFDGIDVNIIAPYQIPYEDEIEEVINQLKV